MLRLTVVCLAVLGVGCAPQQDSETVLDIATSLPPHAWLIERVGGDGVRAAAVLEPGDSPATYQPSDAEVSSVLAATAYFRTGVPFESGPWFGSLSARLEVIDLRNGITMRAIETPTVTAGHESSTHHHATGTPDPHIWLSPKRLQVQARTIADALKRLAPERSSQITRSWESVRDELAVLDESIAKTLGPYRGRSFVVFHPSWGYLAEDYGLLQVAIEIGGKEPSDAEITALRRQIAEIGASIVFVQPQIAGQSARAVAEVVGARLETLDPLRPDLFANLRLSADKIARSFDD
jgi:zinc transport system substrate-binding protein